MIITNEGNLVKLFGRIWDGDGPYITAELERLNRSEGPLDIWMHSPGGSVFDGNLIYNCVQKIKATTHNAGLAASMGGVILFAGSRITMAANAFIMIHAPSGCICGTAKDFEQGAKLLRSMERNFIKLLVKRTGKPEEEVLQWMDGDNWFNAEEALELGLIDEIVDDNLEDFDAEACKDIAVCAATFAEWDRPATTYAANWKTGLISAFHGQPILPPQNLNSNSEMKLNAESLKTLGLNASATDAELDQSIAQLEQRAIAGDKAKETLESYQKTAVESLIGDAVKAGKISGAEKEQWTADATANFEMAKRALDKIPGKKQLPAGNPESADAAAEAASSEIPADRKDWTHADWKQKDWTGFLALKQSNPEAYEEIRKRK